VEFLGVPGGESEDDEDNDDIAQFERQCAERAAAAGLPLRDEDDDISEPEQQADGRHSGPAARAAPSPRTDEEWQRGCASLQSQLEQKEAELEQARTEFERLRRDTVGAGAAPPNDAARELKQRVMDLIRKNRRLESTSESQQKKLEQLQEAVRKPREEAQRQADELVMRNADAMFSDGAEDWKNKYLVASNKLQDARQELQDLRVQLQRQKRALLKELGSDEVLESALAVADDPASGQWRGRAVQVSQLQRQLKELKEQAKQSGTSIAEDGDLASPRLGSVAAQGRSPARNNATQAADRRREEYERLQDEIERLCAEGVEVKRKRDGLKSRNSALESQLRDVKASVVELLQKSDQDDKDVELLRSQLGRHGVADGLPSTAVEALRHEHAQLRAQLERQAQILVQMKQQNMSKVCESGSVRLGPKSAEAGTDDEQLIERLRYLEAENAHQQEQLKLLRGIGVEGLSTPSVGVAASTPPSSRSGASISRTGSFACVS